MKINKPIRSHLSFMLQVVVIASGILILNLASRQNQVITGILISIIVFALAFTAYVCVKDNKKLKEKL